MPFSQNKEALHSSEVPPLYNYRLVSAQKTETF